ncbi:MAG: diguanylate cyclase [Chloroflexaceae bacterium]|nr:diguanylate cyclase [Chloroflexaceae bacterium]
MEEPETLAEITALHQRIAELEQMIAHLMIERRRAEDALHRMNAELEQRVQERTLELARANKALQAEIYQRQEKEQEWRESEHRLQTLFDKVDDFLFVFDVDGHILHSNPVVWRRLGYVPEALQNMHMLNIYPPDQQHEALDAIVAMISGQSAVCTIPLQTSDGTLIPVQTRVTHGNWDNRDVFFSISRDISDLKQAQEALEQANQQLKHSVDELTQRNHDITLLNEMGDKIHFCESLDDAYTIVEHIVAQLFPNQSGALYMSLSRGEMSLVARWGPHPPGQRVVTPHHCPVVQGHHLHLINDPQSAQRCHLCPIDRSISAGAVPYACVPLVAHGETMGVLHLRNGPHLPQSVRDLWEHLAVTTARKLALELSNLHLRERLRNQAVRDPLTGLFNRRYLDETLKRELQRAHRHAHPVGVIMLDIDHFKQFNDTYGHDGGDTLLRALGSALQTQTRGEDIVCRYGGEEFTLILPGATLEQTYRRAEQLLTLIRNLQVQHDGHPLRSITASLGVAIFPEHGATDEAVVKAADCALYLAKTRGRDQIVVAGLME